MPYALAWNDSGELAPSGQGLWDSQKLVSN